MKDYPVIKVAILFVAGILSCALFPVGHSVSCNIISINSFLNSFLQEIRKQFLLLNFYFSCFRYSGIFYWKYLSND